MPNFLGRDEELELVSLVQAGDECAFATLLDSIGPRIDWLLRSTNAHSYGTERQDPTPFCRKPSLSTGMRSSMNKPQPIFLAFPSGKCRDTDIKEAAQNMSAYRPGAFVTAELISENGLNAGSAPPPPIVFGRADHAA